MKLGVDSVERTGDGVLVATLRHPRRPALPGFTAGAHVDVHVPDGRVRHYSLCGDPHDRSTYRIAVKLEESGRGGSRWLHETVRAGGVLTVSAPRNHFELEPGPAACLLLGAGIGITPILSMALHLARTGTPFWVHQFARSREAAPLRREIAEAAGPERTRLHLDDEPATLADLAALLAARADGTHLYCCGPAGFMDAVRAAAEAAGWTDDTVHFEAFQPLFDEGFVPEPFGIEIASSGATLAVPARRSALAVLAEAGIALPSSCEIGVCGSCECGFTAGDPIHRDVVLSPRARRDRFIPCVSRASGTLRLAL